MTGIVEVEDEKGPAPGGTGTNKAGPLRGGTGTEEVAPLGSCGSGMEGPPSSGYGTELDIGGPPSVGTVSRVTVSIIKSSTEAWSADKAKESGVWISIIVISWISWIGLLTP